MLRDGRGDADLGPHRQAFEALERAAVTEANRLSGDATVPAVVRARVRSFVTATTRATTRTTLRTATTPQPPTAIVPRAPTPVAQPVPPLPRATTAGPRPGLGPLRAATPNSFPGLVAVGALGGPSPPASGTPANDAVRQRLKDFLVALAAEWTCAHCGVDLARTLHVSRVQSGRAGVLVDVVCANCGRRSPLPPTQAGAFDSLFGSLIGMTGTGFRPETWGLSGDGT